VRNPALHEAVRALGADAVIDPDDFVDHGPYDVILELIGAPNLPRNLEALAVDGRISVIGVGAGAQADVNLLMLMAKRASIRGSTLRARPLEAKAAAALAVEHHVAPLLAAGRVTVPVTETFPLDDAAAAYERFAQGGKLGKIVLTL
jgi:NADPH:quinone reductase-like Zn-dependent oxidoreductase